MRTLVLDPETAGLSELMERRKTWFARAGGDCEPTERSRLIDLGPDELAMQIRWPAVEQG